MGDITKESLKAYLQEIYHFKAKIIKRKVASLKAMFNYLEYEDDNFINPFRKIKIRLKEPQILPTVMTLDEVKKILNVMYKEMYENEKRDRYTYKAQIRNIAIVEILFSTGLRVSEVCNLKNDNFNLKNGEIIVFGKGSRERIIQICQSDTLSIIKTYYQLHKRQINSKHFFFINRLGYPLSSQSVRLMVKAYSKKAGLAKHITPHTLRHSILSFRLKTSKLQNGFSQQVTI